MHIVTAKVVDLEVSDDIRTFGRRIGPQQVLGLDDQIR